MFGTLRYLPENQAGEFLERESGVNGNIPTNKPQHSACDNCRIKKIRCSGRRAGCSRCKTLSLPCNYTPTPARKGRTKPASNSERTDHRFENGGRPESSAAPGRSPAREAEDAAPPAAVQPTLSTMEPPPLYMVEESYIGMHKAIQGSQGNAGTVLNLMKDTLTWSNCLDWSPGKEVPCLPEFDYLMTENPHLAVDSLLAGYPGTGNTVQPPPPPSAHGFAPLDMLPTPSLTSHTLVSTENTTRSRESPCTSELAMEELNSCLCLGSAVFLLDELEWPHHESSPDEWGLDFILSIYQEVLVLCRRMIICDVCRRKSENMMVLTMVLERLTILCGEVIDAFIAQRGLNGPGVTAVPSAMMKKQPLVVGEYQIEGGDYEVMMGMLVTRRLLELEGLLARIKMINASTRRAHQQARLGRVDQHLKNLFQKLTSVCPLVTEWKVDLNRSVVADKTWRNT
ncbi:Zn(II)2Cys6 transcription factor domain-containing protein [Aspergillus saccharolyticus JOP 1030-1]|uniref:Putative Zn(II)2Cys6 transcription factor n=1 Tax=Aspergillus saccharolyticus JOP 1030-1 TaxID=1450539 RepID=A0A318ZGU6_9EURO|nr:putative Zn(II)2Cys6 transcription factor [Aspergillus saccharolyticus JOP 1030-1]PYH43803.1 putative Zn(II)2Cys6 transcription factor [Aspergillus saccharolyticus JOP 1030-1]